MWIVLWGTLGFGVVGLILTLIYSDESNLFARFTESLIAGISASFHAFGCLFQIFIVVLIVVFITKMISG